MARSTSISTILLGIAIGFAALAFYGRRTLNMIYFALFTGRSPTSQPPYLSCPRFDVTSFKGRLLQTPTVLVNDIEECSKHGMALNSPLICKLKSVDESTLSTVVEALRSDDTTYNTVCFNGGDTFWTGTPHGHKANKLEEVFKQESNCSAGFIYGPEHTKLMRKVLPIDEEFDPKAVLKIKAGEHATFTTSFVSNFPNNRISTGTHAAMVTSMAYQLVGRKVWLMHNMEESASDYYFMSVWKLFPKICLQSWLSGVPKFWVATTTPGDVLFFPLAFQHLVYTEKGPNVMTNIRELTKPTVFSLLSYFSYSSVVKMVGSRLFPPVANNPRESREEYFYFLTKVRDSIEPQEWENYKDFEKMIEAYLL